MGKLELTVAMQQTNSVRALDRQQAIVTVREFRFPNNERGSVEIEMFGQTAVVNGAQLAQAVARCVGFSAT